MRSRLLFIGLLLSACIGARDLSWDWWPTGIQDSVPAGQDTLRWMAGISAVASSSESVPFWLQSNMTGYVSASPYSGNLTAGIYKEAQHDERWWDYDFGVQITGRAEYPKKGTGYFNQLYAHVRLYIFDVTAGIKPLIYETQDTALTSGALVFSGNSQPLPHITIGIDRYVPFPGCYGYFEIKGGLTHAWMTDNAYVKNCLLHHKFAAVRFGGRLPVNLSYEFHHAAEWGGISPVYGPMGNGWKDFMHVLLAQGGGVMHNDIANAQGNHVGSQQLMLTGKGKGWQVNVYWQNFFEDNFAFIGNGQNITDGLWGVSMKQTRWPFIEGVLYEFLNTTDQSGPWHDRDGLCYAGNDQYYQNGVYRNGWFYYGRSMGTPFISPNNSRVRIHHVGVRGDIYGFKYRFKASYARNYGNDVTSRKVLSTNTAVLLEVSKIVPQAWGLEFGVRLAGDFGSQFGNNFGAQISIRKRDILCKW